MGRGKGSYITELAQKKRVTLKLSKLKLCVIFAGEPVQVAAVASCNAVPRWDMCLTLLRFYVVASRTTGQLVCFLPVSLYN